MTNGPGDGSSSPAEGPEGGAITSEHRSEPPDPQFRALVQAVEEYAIFRLDPAGHVVSWNAGAERIKGYDADQILGEHFSTFYTASDREAGVPQENLAAAAEQGAITDVGWRVRKNGSEFWADVTITAIRDDDGELQGFAKVTRDMTDRKRAREEHQLHLSVSHALAEATSLAAGIQAVLEEVCEWTDWMVGQAWIPNEDRIAGRLPAADVEDPAYAAFEEASREYTFAPGEGIPGRVVESGEPVWFPDVTDLSASVFPRTAHAADAGLQAGLGVPVIAEGEVAVVLEFYMAQERDIDDHLVEVVSSIAADLGGLVARRQAEEELDRERELLTEMMAAAPVGISVLTADGRVERMNGQARALRDLSPDAAGLDATDRVFFDDDGNRVPADERPFALVRESQGPVYDWTAQVELPSGGRKWLSIDAAPIEGDDGTLDRVVVIEEDVTELREQYRAITESITDVIVTIDEDSVIQSLNPAIVEVLGYEPADLRGEPLTELMPEEHRNRHREALSRYLETGRKTLDWNYVELPGRRADGSEVPLGVSFSEIWYRGDRYFTGVLRDISARKEAEARLESRARQQAAIAELGQLALETDDLDEVMYEATRTVADVLDNEYCKVLDLDSGERELLLRQGVGWQEGIVGHATVAADENSQAGYTLLSEEPVVVEDLETETRFSGPELLTSHDVKSGISTIIGSTEDPWGILGTHDTARRSFTEEDVNFVQSVANILADAIERHDYQRDLERLVGELEASNDRLEQFAYAASHDLQEPLRMISSFLNQLKTHYDDELDEQAHEFIEYAVDGAERMRTMVQDLLAYSRLDAEAAPLEPTDAETIVEAAIESLQMQIEEHEVEIVVEELPTVEADGNQLEQIFQNLISNAIKYRDGHPPRVEIGADRVDGMARFRVADNGIGMDPAYTDQIFEVFKRLHTDEEYPGTGVGLALCDRIVARHGGDIWVDSELGEGSTFYFTLPLWG